MLTLLWFARVPTGRPTGPRGIPRVPTGTRGTRLGKPTRTRVFDGIPRDTLSKLYQVPDIGLANSCGTPRDFPWGVPSDPTDSHITHPTGFQSHYDKEIYSSKVYRFREISLMNEPGLHVRPTTKGPKSSKRQVKGFPWSYA